MTLNIWRIVGRITPGQSTKRSKISISRFPLFLGVLQLLKKPSLYFGSNFYLDFTLLMDSVIREWPFYDRTKEKLVVTNFFLKYIVIEYPFNSHIINLDRPCPVTQTYGQFAMLCKTPQPTYFCVNVYQVYLNLLID